MAGVLAAPRSVRSTVASGEDLDLPLDSEAPVAPCTRKSARLDDSDLITASTMIKELVASSDGSTTSPSVSGMRSPALVITNDGSAIASSSPSGYPKLKRVVVRPLVEDKLKDWSPLTEDAMAGPLLPYG